MAITVSNGANPRLVTAVSDTITTDTEFNDNAPNDRSYIRPEDIAGAVNAGVTVGGFGLLLQADGPGTGVTMTNDGAVIVNQATDALQIEGDGGPVTYGGTGIVTNTGAGRAILLDNSDGGNIDAVIENDITANTGSAITISTPDTGIVTFTQAAGTVISNASGGDDVISIFGEGGVVANLNGTITGGGQVNVISDGAITINSAADIDADDHVLVATGNGTGLVTVNMTGGEVRATFGINAIANGDGGVVVNMTGGQVGDPSAMTDVALQGRSSGLAGNVDMTLGAAATVFGSTGISATIDNAASTGNVNVTVDGTVDLAFFGIFTLNDGTGTTSITNNGTVTADTGIRVFSGAASVLNTGTLTGTTAAINFNSGDDTLTITRTSVINGNVLAQGGVDRLRLAGTGTGEFDLSDIGGGQQYQDFEQINVVSGTWLLTGSNSDEWTVLGGTLGGTAVLGALTVRAGGTLAPGASAGRIDAGDVRFEAGATYAVEIGGTAPTQFDHIEANVGLRLDGATLDVAFIDGFAPARGDSFMIIDNDTALAVHGTFAGLAEGAVLDVAGTDFAISYVGNDGNDVVLTALTNPPRAALGDVLWRHSDGTPGTANVELPAVPLNFSIAGTGDFDHDGDADIVWRHTDGLTVTWEMAGEALVATHVLPQVPTNFTIAGTGDFDHDGDDDILWRHDEGPVVIWEMEGGALVTNHNLPQGSTHFEIAGTGDFDGDGDADILWRHDQGAVVIWEMENGALVTNHNLPAVPANFQVAGTGDFDGDGDADILWRHTDGLTVSWEMENGALLQTHSFGVVSINFAVQGVADFDSDGDADILWRHTEGLVVTWDMEDGALQQTHDFGVTVNAWQVAGTGELDLV